MPSSETIRRRTEARKRAAAARKAEQDKKARLGDQYRPPGSGDYPNQVKATRKNTRNGGTTTTYQQWNEETKKWESPKAGFNRTKVIQDLAALYAKQQAIEAAGGKPGESKRVVDRNKKLTVGPLEGATPDGSTKRWPNDQIQKETDYVFFQFGKYIPPLSQDALNDSGNDKKRGYNQSITRMKVDKDLPSIMLPIPQDLSNTLAAGWQGKAFTGMGRSAIAAMAGGSMDALGQKISDYTGNLRAIQDSLTSSVLNLVPGVGGNLDANDISGATRGVVLNPNAELLYDSPELREIGMSFKMVPRNNEEAQIIRAICQAFRKAALPTWGGGDGPLQGLRQLNKDGTIGKAFASSFPEAKTTSGENFIRVPRLCKFTFMQGNKPHEYLTQFKPCAMSGVTVNFTPDNTYATYDDGSPVATELRINFQETKIIFAGEVKMKGGSF